LPGVAWLSAESVDLPLVAGADACGSPLADETNPVLANGLGRFAVVHGVRLLAQSLLALQLRREFPFETMPVHGLIVLAGQPGTGKTTLARGLANQIAGADLSPELPDMIALFNANLGEPDCLADTPFYLGLDLVFASVPGMAISKTLGIALLAAYAAFSRAPILALALVLSACGDYALALDPPAREAGMAFFGSAHMAYIVLFALAILRFGLRKDGLILTIALTAFGVAMFVWLQPGLGPMAGPVTAYLAVIVVMAALAAMVNGPRLITLGAVLFVISDSLIAAGWFRGLEVQLGRFDLHGAAIWTSYYLAQAGIAVGVVRMKKAAAGD